METVVIIFQDVFNKNLNGLIYWYIVLFFIPLQNQNPPSSPELLSSSFPIYYRKRLPELSILSEGNLFLKESNCSGVLKQIIAL